MSEIKVGEYVRTKEGYIGKLVEIIPNALNYLKIDIGREIIHCDNSRDDFIYTRYGFQLKHSPNIIDLIEVGDYVNGYKVLEKTKVKNEQMQICIYKDNDCSCWRTINNITLKSIVTKEQFKEVEYKV